MRGVSLQLLYSRQHGLIMLLLVTGTPTAGQCTGRADVRLHRGSQYRPTIIEKHSHLLTYVALIYFLTALKPPGRPQLDPPFTQCMQDKSGTHLVFSLSIHIGFLSGHSSVYE